MSHLKGSNIFSQRGLEGIDRTLIQKLYFSSNSADSFKYFNDILFIFSIIVVKKQQHWLCFQCLHAINLKLFHRSLQERIEATGCGEPIEKFRGYSFSSMCDPAKTMSWTKYYPYQNFKLLILTPFHNKNAFRSQNSIRISCSKIFKQSLKD